MRSGRRPLLPLGNAPTALIDKLLSEGGGHRVHVGEDLDERSVAEAHLVLQAHARGGVTESASSVQFRGFVLSAYLRTPLGEQRVHVVGVGALVSVVMHAHSGLVDVRLERRVSERQRGQLVGAPAIWLEQHSRIGQLDAAVARRLRPQQRGRRGDERKHESQRTASHVCAHVCSRMYYAFRVQPRSSARRSAGSRRRR